MGLSRVITFNGSISFQLGELHRDLGVQSITLHEDCADGSWLVYRDELGHDDISGEDIPTGSVRISDAAAIEAINRLILLLNNQVEEAHSI